MDNTLYLLNLYRKIKQYNLLSLFSGCGGLDYGFEQAGFTIKEAYDNDKAVSDTYSANFPNTNFQIANIRKLNFSEGQFEGIIGGPPCQSWSVAGAGRGSSDERGSLFKEYVRIIREVKPKFFIAENVKGILSKRHTADLAEILRLFDEAGYNVTYKCLNAYDFGVAQDRHRVFFVGFRNDIVNNFSFPESTSDRKVLKDVLDPKHKYSFNIYYGDFSPRYMSRNRIRKLNEPSFTIPATAKQVPLHPSSGSMIKKSKDSFFLSDPSNTRRFSVEECLAIQSFPSTFKLIYNKLENGYKMVGNAVPPLLAEEVANKIKNALCFQFNATKSHISPN